MIGCMQLYLNRGLIECAHINLEKKKMIDSTCEEFVEYFESIEIGKEIHKKELFENFKKEFGEYGEMQPVRFSRWLKDAAKIRGVNINERKSGTERYITVGELETADKLDTLPSADKLDRSLFD